MVTATKAANGNYLEASSVSTAITINPKGLTVSGLTGVNKEFDRSLTGTVTGTPTLVGVVGSDNVLLGGTPTFTFASTNVGSGITVTASGYTLTGTTATNYTLTQPTVTANITAKAARVAATNTTVAFGAPVTSGVTASGLISPDAVGSASYTYTGTGTSTPPTAVGVYTVTPSSAVLSTGLIGNYTISYDTATVTILAKYTITYNANGGVVASSPTTTVDFVVGDAALTLPTPTRANYTFTGWHTLQSNGVQVTGAYTPTATATLWAHWVQNSLYGMGANTKILTITTLAGVGNTYSANAGGGTVAIEYLADALAAGTVIDAYVLSDTTSATSLIGSGNDYVMSLVLAWVHPTTGLVETTATGKPIIMTITNSVIKKGAKIYSVIGVTPTLLTTATTNGSAIISITDDPQIIIAITKPDAPTGVSATSGGNASTTVSWTAPSDGGSAITGYTATSNAGQTCSSATTSCSITGLTNGTAYTFTVTATNSIGISDPSAPSSAITPVAPAAPVVAAQTSGGGGGGGGGGGYVAPTPEPAPTVDPAVAAAAAAAAKALAEKVAAEEKAVGEAKAAADAKALADKKAAEEAELLATLKALQEKADAEALAAAKRVQEELAAAQLKADEELAAAAALKLAEEQRIAAALAESKKITTVYSTSAAFKLNKTYTKRLNTNTKKIAAGSTVTCIGYAKSSKNTSYAKAKVVATKQAKALCSSMKKINPTLITKSIVYPASKAPVTTVNKKWIPISYRVAVGIN
jgi:titin